jgi:hypothetical protein
MVGLKQSLFCTWTFDPDQSPMKVEEGQNQCHFLAMRGVCRKVEYESFTQAKVQAHLKLKEEKEMVDPIFFFYNCLMSQVFYNSKTFCVKLY